MKNTDHGIDIVIIQEYFVDRTVLEDRKLKKKKKTQKPDCEKPRAFGVHLIINKFI